MVEYTYEGSGWRAPVVRLCRLLAAHGLGYR